MAKAKKTSQQTIAFIVVALLVGWTLGYLVGAVSTDDTASSEETYSGDTLDSHLHEGVEVDEAEAPTVEVVADEDKLGGWNISIVTTNFEFTPKDVNEADEIGTGHAHIWVDGEKIGRVYGSNYHLAALGEGEHEITVSLNTNTHKDYLLEGEPIRASVEVIEGSDTGDGHSHSADMDDHSHEN